MRKIIEFIEEVIENAAEMIKDILFKIETFWLGIMIIILLLSIKKKGEKNNEKNLDEKLFK